MKSLVFRVDSGLSIGSGHLMRCLTLAKNLSKSTKLKCIFVTRNHAGNFNDLITLNGYKLMLLENLELDNKVNNLSKWLGASQEVDAIQTQTALKEMCLKSIDILVVDHYAIDINWEKKFRNIAKKLVVIDDLANRLHCCDILLDQNIAPNYLTRYDNLVPISTKKFLGISWCLLREDFLMAKRSIKPRSKLRNIAIFFGGVDEYNATLKLLNNLKRKLVVFNAVYVIVGQSNPFKEEINWFCDKRDNCYYLEQVSNMAEIFSKSDLAIGAGGATTGERIFLGLPSIIFSLADNQVKVSKYLHEKRYVTYLGDQSEIDKSNIISEIDKYINSSELLKEQSLKLLSVGKSKLSQLVQEIASD